MEIKGQKIGFAITGSFCTFATTFIEIENLAAEGAILTPIMSKIARSTNTRFGNANDFADRFEQITKNTIIDSINGAEPIGPKNLLDALVIAPCTGNTLSKLANGITDTPVTMAAKATMRNGKPIIIALSTNDGLGANAKNIGILLNTKNMYFVPFRQDDPLSKTNSLVASMDKLIPTLKSALDGIQIQPVVLGN